MKQSTENELKGKFKELKGAVTEKVGHALDNPKLENKGLGQKIEGKVQKKVGQIQKVLEK